MQDLYHQHYVRHLDAFGLFGALGLEVSIEVLGSQKPPEGLKTFNSIP